MWNFIIAIAYLAILGQSKPNREDNVLHIGGIFPLAGEGGWQGGQVKFYSLIIKNLMYELCYSL